MTTATMEERKRSPIAYAGLALCTFCMCAASQLIQLSKRSTGSYQYSYYTLNSMVEGTKLILSLVMLVRSGSTASLSNIPNEMNKLDRSAVLRYAIPAVIYLLNNNLYYVILYFMDAATFQVAMNLKIVATGVFMYLVMKKHLSATQWSALAVLTVGAMMAQLDKQGSSPSGDSNAPSMSAIGMGLALVYCCMSALAGVTTELLLKGARSTSLHASNIVLYTYGFVFNIGAYLLIETRTTSFFQGVTPLTLCIVANSATMGIIISAIMKHFDNIVKVYLAAVSMLISMLISTLTTSFELTIMFNVAVALVALSAVAYNRNAWPFCGTPPQAAGYSQVSTTGDKEMESKGSFGGAEGGAQV